MCLKIWVRSWSRNMFQLQNTERTELTRANKVPIYGDVVLAQIWVLMTIWSSIANLHLAYRQSITALNISSLFWIEKLIKFVSMRMWYGGPSWVLCEKKSADDVLTLMRKLITSTSVYDIILIFPTLHWLVLFAFYLVSRRSFLDSAFCRKLIHGILINFHVILTI